MKILFITSNSLGDVVLSTGVLRWLVESYPNAYFTIVCGPLAANLLSDIPRLDNIYVLTKKKWHMHMITLWKKCFNTKWDLLIDLRNTPVSRILRAKKRAIHWWGRNNEHRVIDNARVLNLCPIPDPQIWIHPKATLKTEQLTPKDTRILAICPTAGWSLKQWPIDNYIALVQTLISERGIMAGATVIVYGASHERSYITPLLESIPKSQCIEMIGEDLQYVAACLKKSQLFIGNDSGMMHLSAAVGVPTLGLFGATSTPQNYAPWGSHCSYLRATKPPEAKEGDNTMTTITVEQVLTAVSTMLH